MTDRELIDKIIERLDHNADTERRGVQGLIYSIRCKLDKLEESYKKCETDRETKGLTKKLCRETSYLIGDMYELMDEVIMLFGFIMRYATVQELACDVHVGVYGDKEEDE